MAGYLSKSLQFIQMLDPLQLQDSDTEQTKMESSENVEEHSNAPFFAQLDKTKKNSSENGERHSNEPFVAQLDKEIDVQRWSVDDVADWFQRNVTFQSERMEEFSRALRNEGIDGLRLLALQRNNHACSGMTDSEWVLLNVARESLLISHERVMLACESHTSSPNFSTLISPRKEESQDTVVSSLLPVRLETSGSMPSMTAQNYGLLSSSAKFLSFPRHWWSFGTAKDEQSESIATEVHSLQEEIASAEEREAALKAKIDHLDEILRTAQLASYLFTRLRWMPLPGELPADDVDVDDWLQRFLVLQGSTIFFYPQAADLRPQGAILLSEIVDFGQMPRHVHHQQDDTDWFGFYITTCDGLRLECSTPLRLQMELWLSSIQADHEGGCGEEAK